MCLCTYIHGVYICTFVCMNVRMLAFLFVYVRILVCEDLHIRMYVCMYACMHVCMFICLYVWIYVCL